MAEERKRESLEEDQEPLPKRPKLSDSIRSHDNNNEDLPPETARDSGGVRTEEAEEDGAMLAGQVLKHMKEVDVGISEYISTTPGFFAIIKQLYSDFIVREVSASGEVVKLTSFSPPPPVAGGDTTKGVELTEVFTPSEIERLRHLTSGTRSSLEEGKSRECIEIKAAKEKGKRTMMHQLLKTHFPSLTSRTVEASADKARELTEKDGEVEKKKEVGNKIIQVSLRQGSGEEERGRWQWPGGKNKYCRFTLYKENRDVVEVINYLARELGVRSNMFHSAGLKDRRAITTQHYTLHKVNAERLLALNDSLIKVKIGNPVYVREPLKLGQLKGNNFTIVLRNVSCDDHVIQEKMTSLKERGFINYFGMQRFGTSTIPTHLIGRCILHCDWKGAVDLILKQRPGEPEELDSARQYYDKTKDAAGTLERLPRRRPIERAVLKGLAEQRGGVNDYLGAIKSIPFSSRLMYVHSYQSMVWNRVTTWRIRQHGLRPVPGDLVTGRIVGKPLVITEDTVDRYTIHDVVLPLPGFDVQLPRNDVKGEYEAILKEDKLTTQHFNHRVRDFILYGSYRPVVVKPKDVEWDSVRYDDNVPLILTDCDKLDNKPLPQSVEGGKYKALRMSFSLPAASYATMAVRELLKMETSSYHQAQLNPPSSNHASNSTSPSDHTHDSTPN